MVFKIVMCCAFVVCGACTGMYFAARLTKRRVILEDLIRALQLLENEIYYTRGRLDKVAGRVSLSGDREAADLFARFAEMLSERSTAGVPEIWDKAVDACFPAGCPLDAKDTGAVHSFGMQLGTTDVEGQINNAKRTIKELSVRLSDARSCEQQKSRVYRTAGTACGILCAVLTV